MRRTTFLLAAGCGLILCASASAQDFHGYPCTEDCAGHVAGYEWAERKGIDDESDCGGNSNSFIEGCEAYVEEQKADEAQDQERSEEPSDE